MSRTSGRSRRTGDSGSYLDGATGPLPLFGGLAAAAAVVALGGPVGWATAVGLATLGASAVPGLNRATKARAQQEKQARVAEERRRAAMGGRRDRWERLRHTADESHDRFERAVERCQPGPLRDRLRDMAPEVERARARVGHLVDLGIDLEEAIVDRRRADAAKGGKGDKRPHRKGRTTATTDGPTARLEAQRDEVERRAQDIDTSLAASVAVAFELTLDSIHVPDERGVGDLVGELESLRDALAELRARPDPT